MEVLLLFVRLLDSGRADAGILPHLSTEEREHLFA